MAHVLALDLGSSSVRALVLDHPAANPRAFARRPVDLMCDSQGRGEIDPERYLTSVVACLDELSSTGALDDVADVVLASQWHSLVAIDARSRPVSAVLTWADGRGTTAALSDERLHALHERTGAWPHPQFWVGKAPWLLAQVPSAALLLGLPELLNLHLLGDVSMSGSMASGTGLYDWAAQRWDEEALELAGVTPAFLPPLQAEDWRGTLRSEWRRRWPPLARATWHGAVGDGAAANVGTGCVDSSQINVTIGTSTGVRVVESAQHATPISADLWRFRVDSRRVVSGVAFSAGGASHAWARALTQLPAEAHDHPGLSDIPPGSAGLTVLPFHAGARAPRRVPAGKAVVAGLSLASGALHLVSATMEAVAFEVAEAIEAIEVATGRESTVIACGGAIEASTTWQSRLAGVLDRPVHVVRVPEASARGAALVALHSEPVQQEVDVVVPQAQDVRLLGEARRRFMAVRQAHGIAPVTVAP